jgi:hypothetical protein
MKTYCLKKALIPVGKEWAIVDTADFASVNQYKWKKHSKGYAYRFERDSDGVNKMILMHRQIMQPGEGLVVDHINHDTLDNTRGNLRVCTQGENMKNQKKTQWRADIPTSSRYKGVYRHKNGKFKATIWNNGVQEHLKYHDTEIEAALAYDKRARELHGEFAVLNFP